MMTMMVDVAINPDKFDKLIASLRTAVDRWDTIYLMIIINSPFCDLIRQIRTLLPQTRVETNVYQK